MIIAKLAGSRDEYVLALFGRPAVRFLKLTSLELTALSVLATIALCKVATS
jgi:hypothetical protein